ncbi:MAG: thioredoxin-like domain-containing protein, partial [Planctomycetaceae bacterium]
MSEPVPDARPIGDAAAAISRPRRAAWRPAGWLLLALLAGGVLVGGYALATQKDKADAESGENGDAAAAEAPAAGRDAPPDAPQETEAMPENPFPNAVSVPGGVFDGAEDWLNASGPIEIGDLKGKIVLVDFWTYCCINCMHVLPDLKYLEHKYPNELVVIGVHSAKFDNEKETENIRRAVQRYEIEHPVVNDANMLIWRRFGVHAWPTLAVIDPEGNYCGSISGEGHRALLEEVIDKLIAHHKAKGTLDETPVRFALESDKLKPTPLRFPGKVLADEASGRVFVADTNHNRIIVGTLDGTLIDVIGSGASGRDDGGYDEATFNHPQGMALAGETLYVADTENHLLRKVDLETKTVTTLAGTGKQDRERLPPAEPLQTPLNSPWDVEAIDGVLYIAMAGPHQIWSYDLKTRKLAVYAGTGREDVLNGPRAQAAFAQPSGFATDGEFLYIADSEGSAIRRIALSDGTVTTIAGTSELPRGQSLFTFGDQDGTGNEARLQHPIGVAYHDGILYVADSYNHKIKKAALGEDAAAVESWLGNGERGAQLDPPRFNEPHGLSIAHDQLYVADTNNHRILIAGLKTDQVSEFTFSGLAPPEKPEPRQTAPVASHEAVEIEPQRIQSGGELKFEVSVTLPEGYK